MNFKVSQLKSLGAGEVAVDDLIYVIDSNPTDGSVKSKKVSVGDLIDSRIYGISSSQFVLITGYYADPSWILSLDWSKIINAPSFVTSLSALTDVQLSTPLTGQALVYNGTKWVNQGIGELDTLNSVTTRGNTTTNNITVGTLYFGNASHYLVTDNASYAMLSSNRTLQLATSGNPVLSVFTSQNVAIGTTTDSGYKLNVAGTIRSSGTNGLILYDGTYGAKISMGSYIFTIEKEGSYGVSTYQFKYNDNSNALYLSGLTSIIGVGGGDDGVMMSRNVYAPHNAAFGFTTYGSTTKYKAIQALFTDNSTSGVAFNYKTAGVDTEAMRINSAGNVGIGTTSPTWKLEVSSAGYTGFGIMSGANNNAEIHFQNTGYSIPRWTIRTTGTPNGSSGNLTFQRLGSTFPLTITSGDNVLIGTGVDSGYKLDVNGTGRFNNTVLIKSAYVSGGSVAEILNVNYADDSNAIRVLQGAVKQVTLGTTTGGDVQIEGILVCANNTTTAAALRLGSFNFRVQGNGQTAFRDDSTNAFVNSSALVEMVATSRGFLQPRMTNTQALAITTPATGLQLYDTTNNKNLLYNGTLWQNIATETWVAGQGFPTGSGTVNYLPKFTSATTLGNSNFVDDGVSPTIWVNSQNSGSRFYFSPVHSDGRINLNAVAGTNNYTLLRAWHTGNSIGLGTGSSAGGGALTTYSDSVLIGTSGAIYFMAGTFGPTNVPYRLGITTNATVTGFHTGVVNNLTNIESHAFQFTAKSHTFFTGTTAGNQTNPNQFTPLHLSTSGNVVVGTTTDAGYKLDVIGYGRFKVSGAGVTTALRIENGTGSSAVNLELVGGPLASTAASVILQGTDLGSWAQGLTLKIYDGTAGGSGSMLDRYVFAKDYLNLLSVNQIKQTGTGAIDNIWIATGSDVLNSISGISLSLYKKAAIYQIVSTSALYGVGDIAFAINNTTTSAVAVSTFDEKMRLTRLGNLLVGTSTDSGYKLDVNGAIRSRGAGSVSLWIEGSSAIRGFNTTGGQIYLDASQDLTGTVNIRGTLVNVSNALTASGLITTVDSVNAGTNTNGKGVSVNSNIVLNVKADNTVLRFNDNSQFVNVGMRGNGYQINDTTIPTLMTFNSSALLDVNSTNRGFLPPRLTTTQKNAITTPATGLEVYDSTTNTPNYYNGTTWVGVASNQSTGLSPGLFAQTSDSTPVANTTVETTLISTGVGTLSVPANQFQVGASYIAYLSGVISSQNNATLEIHLRSNGSILADTNPMTLAATTAKFWEMSVNFTVRAIGAGGVAAIVTSGRFSYNKDSGNIPESVGYGNVNSTTFDTTINNSLVITAQWGNASPLNSIQTRVFNLYRVY